MGFAFDRTEDGLVMLRDILVEPEIATVLWYLNNEAAFPEPSFARARRRRRRTEQLPAPNEPLPERASIPIGAMRDGHLDEALVARVDELIQNVGRSFAPAAFMRFERVAIQGDGVVCLGGVTLESRRLGELLTGCRECVLFSTTLGHGIEEPLRVLQDKDDRQSVCLVEAIASAALLDLTQRVQRRVELIARKEGLRVTHCQWPGFCDWPEEHTLRLLPRVGGTADAPIGWAAGAFTPTWSFVGIVGIGIDVSRIRNNPCRRCERRRTCPRRIW